MKMCDCMAAWRENSASCSRHPHAGLDCRDDWRLARKFFARVSARNFRRHGSQSTSSCRSCACRSHDPIPASALDWPSGALGQSFHPDFIFSILFKSFRYSWNELIRRSCCQTTVKERSQCQNIGTLFRPQRKNVSDWASKAWTGYNQPMRTDRNTW